MGLSNLEEVFQEKYYRHLNGGVMEAFGILFTRDLKMYVYPSKPDGESTLKQIKDLELHPRMRPLVDYLVFNKRIVDIEDYDPKVLNIFSREVLEMIRSGNGDWEQLVPAYVDNMIKKDQLFGYNAKETAK